MFSGAQIVTSKLVHHQRREILDSKNEEKTTQDLIQVIQPNSRTKAAIVVETREEKRERKILANERRQERLIEQQKIAHHMENLMDKVLRDTTMPSKDEKDLRLRIKTIMSKVKKDLDKSDASLTEPPLTHQTRDSTSRSQLEGKSSRTTQQGAFLLWYDGNSNPNRSFADVNE